MTMPLLETNWPDAMIATAGAIGAFTLVSVLVWQIFATGRAAIQTRREDEYKKLAEGSTEAQGRIADRLGELSAELHELRVRTGELERMLKEVA
jgi:hypothetical protein